MEKSNGSSGHSTPGPAILSRRERDMLRYREMCRYEKEEYSKGIKLIGGIDEAGRGPLAGPVVAACVILPENVYIKGLNDSKKLTPAARDRLYDEIIEKAVGVGVGIVDEKCIDEINILNATKKAMQLAVENVNPTPEVLLIDALKLENIRLRQVPIIKGDSLSISIAAASVIAKVTRDRLLVALDEKYPVYGFKNHKGYGTKEHINAIKKYGLCPIHRISFTKNILG